jgi:hypothetical protein
MRLKPGAQDQFVQLLEEFRQVDVSVAGFRAEVLYARRATRTNTW